MNKKEMFGLIKTCSEGRINVYSPTVNIHYDRLADVYPYYLEVNGNVIKRFKTENSMKTYIKKYKKQRKIEIQKLLQFKDKTAVLSNDEIEKLFKK